MCSNLNNFEVVSFFYITCFIQVFYLFFQLGSFEFWLLTAYSYLPIRNYIISWLFYIWKQALYSGGGGHDYCPENPPSYGNVLYGTFQPLQRGIVCYFPLDAREKWGTWAIESFFSKSLLTCFALTGARSTHSGKVRYGKISGHGLWTYCTLVHFPNPVLGRLTRYPWKFTQACSVIPGSHWLTEFQKGGLSKESLSQASKIFLLYNHVSLGYWMVLTYLFGLTLVQGRCRIRPSLLFSNGLSLTCAHERVCGLSVACCLSVSQHSSTSILQPPMMEWQVFFTFSHFTCVLNIP